MIMAGCIQAHNSMYEINYERLRCLLTLLMIRSVLVNMVVVTGRPEGQKYRECVIINLIRSKVYAVNVTTYFFPLP